MSCGCHCGSASPVPSPSGGAVNVEDEGVAIPNTPHGTLNFVGAGVTATDGGAGTAIITIPGGAGLVYQSFQFGQDGSYGTGTFVGMTWFNRTAAPLTIQDVTLWHGTGGAGGSTVVDILVDSGGGWTSIWNVTPANRPTLTTGSDTEIQGGAIDNPAIPVGAKVRMDIISTQTGNPQDLMVQVTAV
jgi:hypothetical protein